MLIQFPLSRRKVLKWLSVGGVSSTCTKAWANITDALPILPADNDNTDLPMLYARIPNSNEVVLIDNDETAQMMGEEKTEVLQEHELFSIHRPRKIMKFETVMVAITPEIERRNKIYFPKDE